MANTMAGVLTLTLIQGAIGAQVAQTLGLISCACNRAYRPVCVAGKTYGNLCGAECALQRKNLKSTRGECGTVPDGVIVDPIERKPIDFIDGPIVDPIEPKTIDFIDGTVPDGVIVDPIERKTIDFIDGPIVDPIEPKTIDFIDVSCACNRAYHPVCVAGKTYSNLCSAECALQRKNVLALPFACGTVPDGVIVDPTPPKPFGYTVIGNSACKTSKSETRNEDDRGCKEACDKMDSCLAFSVKASKQANKNKCKLSLKPVTEGKKKRGYGGCFVKIEN